MNNFDKFWKEYPRKQAKSAARTAWKKILPHEVNDIMASLTTQKALKQWKEREYIPHAGTWLNQRRWEDEFIKEDFSVVNDFDVEIAW